MSPPSTARAQSFQVSDIPASVAGVPMRIYDPLDANGSGVLWLHGGGFIGGSYNDPEGDGVARALASVGSIVLTVEYRHADPALAIFYPLPLDDVITAWEWFDSVAAGLGATGAIHLGGASAGGNLALGAAIRLRDAAGPRPSSIMLAYPTLHALQREPDLELVQLLAELPEDGRWSARIVREMYRDYLGDQIDAPPTYAVPGTVDPEGLPPILVLASEIDGLRASAQEYVERLGDVGHPHQYVVEYGALHGHLNTPTVPQSDRSLRQLTYWVQNHR